LLARGSRGTSTKMGTWFANLRAPKEGWRLDIVSLLAVIGEGSMEAHMQPMTSSWTCEYITNRNSLMVEESNANSFAGMLPRIMPAPQALLKPSRPTRMPSFPASVVGVSNGTFVPVLNFFPSIIHPIDDLPAFAFKLFQIKRKNDIHLSNKPPSETSEKTIVSGTDGGVVEAQNFSPKLRNRQSTLQQITKSATKVLMTTEPHIPTKTFSPLNVLSVLSCLLTIGLLIWAALIEDGTACVALGSISLASCIVGYGSWWSPILKQRVFHGYVPPGDVVIRTREGAFIVVKCDEEVARELYTGTEECHYWTKTKTYRVLVGMGTFLLMVSVVLLGNCDFPMQAAIGGSYIALNGAFWLVSLLEKNSFWDMSVYECNDITPQDARLAEEPHPADVKDVQDVQDVEAIASYTRSLWYAIRETGGETAWARISGAAPQTDEWKKWLDEAGEHAKTAQRNWPAVQRRGVIIGTADPAIIHTSIHGSPNRSDSGLPEQNAPATQIPPPATR
jgi:hypothetical protein